MSLTHPKHYHRLAHCQHQNVKSLSPHKHYLCHYHRHRLCKSSFLYIHFIFKPFIHLQVAILAIALLLQSLLIRDPHNIHTLDSFVSKPLTVPNLWGDVNFLFPVLAICTTHLVVATTTSHCHTPHTLHVHTLPRNPTNTLPLCAPNCHRLGSLKSKRWSSLALFPYWRVYDQAFELDSNS